MIRLQRKRRPGEAFIIPAKCFRSVALTRILLTMHRSIAADDALWAACGVLVAGLGSAAKQVEV